MYRLILIVFLVFVPALGFSQVKIGVGGGVAWQDLDNHELDWNDKRFAAASDSFDSGPSFYMYAEKEVHRFIALGAAYSYSVMNQQSRAKEYHPDYKESFGLKREIDVDIHAASLYVKTKYSISDSISPFLQGGAGWLYVDSEQLGTPNGMFFTGGGGIEYFINDKWGIEILCLYNKGRAYAGMNDVTDYRYGQTLALLTYRF